MTHAAVKSPHVSLQQWQWQIDRAGNSPRPHIDTRTRPHRMHNLQGQLDDEFTEYAAVKAGHLTVLQHGDRGQPLAAGNRRILAEQIARQQVGEGRRRAMRHRMPLRQHIAAVLDRVFPHHGDAGCDRAKMKPGHQESPRRHGKCPYQRRREEPAFPGFAPLAGNVPATVAQQKRHPIPVDVEQTRGRDTANDINAGVQGNASSRLHGVDASLRWRDRQHARRQVQAPRQLSTRGQQGAISGHLDTPGMASDSRQRVAVQRSKIVETPQRPKQIGG
ncbi:MAG: hypothetical protein R3E84_04005 [Pseudomonadales bacterium]